MLSLKADLHLHSVMSPCADLLMTPASIVKKARKKGIKILALTDHNSAENIEVFKYYCEKNDIFFIPAMETETKEEIHILSYFPDIRSLFKWEKIVSSKLPKQTNDEDFFGPQIKCDYQDQYQAKIDKLLAGAINLSLEEAVDKILELGGIVIPSHLDRKQSIISQLGFIPKDLNFNTVEISKNITQNEALKIYPELKKYQLIQNSDSHYLKEIKAYNKLLIKEFSFQEFKLALKEIKGRSIEIISY